MIGDSESGDYIEFADYDSNLTLESIHRLYFDKQKAIDYAAGLMEFVYDLKQNIAGKTFYVVGQDVNDHSDIWYGQADIDENMTVIKWNELAGTDQGLVKDIPFGVIDGNKVIWTHEKGDYSVPGGNQGDYTLWDDYEGDGSLESHTRFYSDQSKAEAYYKSLTGWVGLIPVISILLQ